MTLQDGVVEGVAADVDGGSVHWAFSAADRIFGQRVGGIVDFVSAHQNQVLALLPFDLELR